ncbi:MAG: hypothetical protein WBZ36_08845 [Candidatus Nitrosopolaris sp.]
MSIGERSPLFSWKGRATSDSSVTPRDGGPLTHFFSGKDEDTMTDSISSADGSPAPLKSEDDVSDDITDVINSPEEPKPPSTPSGWDPDDDQAMRTRFLRAIIAEREKRDQEILLINKEKELIAQERLNLELEKKQLDYEQRNLETRLAEVEIYRDILPSAKQLREMGVDFHEIIIWIEVIRDKATTEGITPKEAVALIVQELKLYSHFNSLKRSVERAQQDLEALNIVIEEHKAAIASLVDLKSNYGVTEGQIVQLIKFAGEWDKYCILHSNGKNNLQQPSNGNNSYDDGNLSRNDLIRLNLLKGSTTNMLNRIGITHMPFSLRF